MSSAAAALGWLDSCVSLQAFSCCASFPSAHCTFKPRNWSLPAHWICCCARRCWYGWIDHQCKPAAATQNPTPKQRLRITKQRMGDSPQSTSDSCCSADSCAAVLRLPSRVCPHPLWTQPLSAPCPPTHPVSPTVLQQVKHYPPSCGRRAWSVLRIQPAYGRNDAYLRLQHVPSRDEYTWDRFTSF